MGDVLFVKISCGNIDKQAIEIDVNKKKNNKKKTYYGLD